MDWLMALVLGTLQGATEFLPVSSTGHLALAISSFGSSAAAAGVAFEVALHGATLFAVLIVLRHDIAEALRRPAIAARIIIATAPLGAALFLRDLAADATRSPRAIGAGFAVTAAALALASWWTRGTGESASGEEEEDGGANRRPQSEALREDEARGIACLTWRGALCVGLCQLVAVFPGVSRSGMTITAGLLCGLSPAASFRFAFLLAIPAIAGATVVEARHISELSAREPLPLLVASAAALAVGIVALLFLRRVLERRRLAIFVPYVGALALWLLIAG